MAFVGLGHGQGLTPNYSPGYPPMAADPSDKVDEGYSEEPRPQEDRDSALDMDIKINDLKVEELEGSHNILGGLETLAMQLGQADRKDLVHRILKTLPTSMIADIVERLRPILHLDPVAILPDEIMSQIFSYLTPTQLLQASQVSRAWKDRTLDSSLWRRKFVEEGWYLNVPRVAKFERDYARRSSTKSLSRKAGSDPNVRNMKRRARGSHGDHPQTPHEDGNPLSGTDASSNAAVYGSDAETRALQGPHTQDAIMQDADGEVAQVESPGLMDTQESVFSGSISTPAARKMLDPSLNTFAPLTNSFLYRNYVGDARIDYHALYNVKLKLEENWRSGKYRSFQFPHQDHPEEAHKECVYTLQFSDRYLVSGSRDKTIRVWSLETQRLVKRPLSGHTGSVLCLQFDDRPDEDIIISGSSDSSVMVWQFSTGKLLYKIPRAHEEPVLNVKFDHRYLATCSKDRYIKLWNRRDLRPGDAGYPVKNVPGGGKCPDYIVDPSEFPGPSDMEHYKIREEPEAIKPFSLIMTIDTHNAAVNAMHIYQDQLASASGDRFVKVFNLRTGIVEANCKGHTKGVACIQYDGRRIVSGSSDETIRIFDPATNAEVAVLDGHTKLVRTLQADFGDAPGALQELEAEAHKSDVDYFADQTRALTSDRQDRSFLPTRRSRSDTHIAIGAKIPPSGGGNRWSRIVSGSYDETVIIWRKDSDGRWQVGHKLKQAEALRAAGGPLYATSELAARQQQALQARQRLDAALQQHQRQDQVVMQQLQASGAPIAHQAEVIGSGVVGHAQMPVQVVISASSSVSAASAAASIAAQTHAAGMGGPSTTAYTNGPPPTPAPEPPAVAHHPAQQQAAPRPLTVAVQLNLPHAAATAAAQAATAIHAVAGQNARVFKLQFDARRIICCSQDPKIVGWDFADGDSEIVEASKFFTQAL